MLYVLYTLCSYNKVSYRKENVIKTIVRKRKFVYSIYWKKSAEKWTRQFKAELFAGHRVCEGSSIPAGVQSPGSVGRCQGEDSCAGGRWGKWLMRSFLGLLSFWTRVPRFPPWCGHTATDRWSQD